MYSMEQDFNVLLNDLSDKDVRVTLLMQVYNAGAKRRVNAQAALDDCKKYYPSDYSLLDVFDDLIDKVPPKALPDVQYAYSRFMNERTADFVRSIQREHLTDKIREGEEEREEEKEKEMEY